MNQDAPMADEATRPDRRYLRQLEISLGVREVPRERADEILAEVADHLAAGGEDPEEAFGQPWELAAALVEARPVPGRQPVRVGVLAVAAFVGPLLVLGGGRAVLTGGTATVALGDVLGVLLGLLALPACLGLAFAYADGRCRAWQPIVGFTAALAAATGARALVDEPLLHDGSGWPLVLAGVGCVGLVAALVGNRRPWAAGGPSR